MRIAAASKVRVRLTRKLAQEIDGIDLSEHAVGDVLDLPAPDAQLMMAEQWAFPERRGEERGSERSAPSRRHDDRPPGSSPPRPSRKPLRLHRGDS